MVMIDSINSKPRHVAAELFEVTLQIPKRFRVQLVFRQERSERIAAGLPAGFCFRFCQGFVQFVSLFGEVRRIAGMGEALKGCLRILSRKRMFYCVLQEGQLVHSAWTTVSRCRHYAIEPNAVVIGPIWSAPEIRGRGIATSAMQLAMNELVARGHTTIYIDTSSNNFPCLSVIEKCGFGSPMTAYVWR
jgi:GNAT superfamily N-acetyltransferase